MMKCCVQSCIPWYIFFEYLQSNIIDLDDMDNDIEMKEIMVHPHKKVDDILLNPTTTEGDKDILDVEDFKKIL